MKPRLISFFMFILGGSFYYLLEILWRGHSHWSMFIAGGTCFLAIDMLNSKLAAKTPFWLRCTLGAAIITAIEFVVGCCVNLWADWHVWDYSRFRFNFLGQICLVYTVIWFFLSAPLIWISGVLRKKLSHILNKDDR